ncbi:MAG: tryptophan 2,3-dioxygenase family protein, partial [Myxococcota bacterium]
MRTPTTYWDYIRVNELLTLQRGLAERDAELSNDEVLFITVHQIDELWFKLILRELVSVRDLFAQPHVPEQSLASAVRGLRRIAELFRQVAQHFSMMETMTTRDYLAFRDKLSPASGFQSAQLREIEILMGLEMKLRVPLGGEANYLEALKYPDGRDSPGSVQVAARLKDRPSLKDAVDAWLHRTPIQGSTPADEGDAAAVQRFIDEYLAAHEAETTRARTFANHAGLSDEDRARLDKNQRCPDAALKRALIFLDVFGLKKLARALPLRRIALIEARSILIAKAGVIC